MRRMPDREEPTTPFTRASTSSSHSLSPVQLVRVARGFSCLFWGLPATLFLLSGVVHLQAFAFIRLPPYVMGTLILFCGVIMFHRAGAVTPRWPGYVRQTIFLVILQVYFAPFYQWWNGMQYETFLLLNVAALLGCAIWALYLFNQLAGLLGIALGDDTFYIEARLCGLAVMALMLLPLLGAGLYGLLGWVRFDSSLYSELSHVRRQIQPWLYGLFLLPFVLTVATAWKAKQLAFRHLSRGAPEWLS